MTPTSSFEPMVGHVYAKISTWVTTLVKMLPNIVVAVVVLVIFWLIGMLVARLTHRGTLRVSHRLHLAKLFSRAARVLVLAIGIVLALDILQLEKGVASILAGLGILGIALGFASKDIVSNFVAGIVLTFSRPFHSGDLIHLGDFQGYVESIETRATICRSLQGQVVSIPNSNFLDKPIINYTTSGVRRIDLSVGVSYGTDLARAAELAIKAVEALERLPDRPVELFYQEFGESSINFVIRFWTKPDQKGWLKARSEAIKAIKRTFDANGITIPFPIRTLDFSTVGGETLREQLETVKLPVPLPTQAGGRDGPGE